LARAYGDARRSRRRALNRALDRPRSLCGQGVRAIKNAARSDRRISNSFQLERDVPEKPTARVKSSWLLVASLPSARPLSTAKSVEDPRR
jgi:hypothetical protein